MNYLKKVCDSGYSRVVFQLGIHIVMDKVYCKDKVKAFELYTKFVMVDMLKVVTTLIFFYYREKLKTRFIIKLTNYLKACDNDISTSYNLGNSYNYGEGIKQDINTAKELCI